MWLKFPISNFLCAVGRVESVYSQVMELVHTEKKDKQCNRCPWVHLYFPPHALLLNQMLNMVSNFKMQELTSVLTPSSLSLVSSGWKSISLVLCFLLCVHVCVCESSRSSRRGSKAPQEPWLTPLVADSCLLRWLRRVAGWWRALL